MYSLRKLLSKGSLAIAFIVFAIAVNGQIAGVDSALIPRPYLHYLKEYDFDKSSDPAKWQEQKNLHVSFASTDEAYFRTEVPGINETKTWTATGWKGERLNTMILFWSADTISQVRVSFNDLKTTTGILLGKNNLKAQLVRYVISNYPYAAREVTCGEGPVDKAYLMPDRLETFDRFELK